MASGGSKYLKWLWVALLLAVAAVIIIATERRTDPQRCPMGLVSLGPRCCGVGQHYESDCTGPAQSCSVAQTVTHDGCEIEPSIVSFSGGKLETSVDDWDLQDRVRSMDSEVVKAFRLDRFEVTAKQWSQCVAAGACPPGTTTRSELPVTEIDADTADGYCRFRGGQLPTAGQWLWAARGGQQRRYPWGAFGLVCRRAAFGLVAGPCATGALGPEVPGSRPDGATAEGVHDLAGNVAEWTRDAPGLPAVARGGSYRSKLAPELKTLATEDARSKAPEIGFRCAYAPL